MRRISTAAAALATALVFLVVVIAMVAVCSRPTAGSAAGDRSPDPELIGATIVPTPTVPQRIWLASGAGLGQLMLSLVRDANAQHVLAAGSDGWIASLAAPNGLVEWTRQVPDLGDNPGCVLGADRTVGCVSDRPVDLAKGIPVAVIDGAASTVTTGVIDTAGHPVDPVLPNTDIKSTATGFVASVGVDDNKAVALAGFDETGKRTWNRVVPASGFASAFVGMNTVVVEGTTDASILDARDGSTVYDSRRDTTSVSTIAAIPLTDGAAVGLGGDQPQTVIYRAGRRVAVVPNWVLSVDTSPGWSDPVCPLLPVRSGGDGSSIGALDPVSGALLWHKDLGSTGAAATVTCAAGYFLVRTGGSGYQAYDARTGAPRGVIASQGMRYLGTDGHRAMIETDSYSGTRSMAAYDLDTGRQVWTVDTAWVAGGRIFGDQRGVGVELLGSQ